MSYQVLARKWRPQNFRDMAGQTHVLQALVNALDHNRLHHAYLFTGTRGVGKTTIARILAKCLNCETGVSSQPCEQCSACREITEGRFVDLIEIDAASHTGVDDVRDLIDNSQYLPTLGRYKVYLIDEVHMLSKSAFNALLKTLEEPPAHVKFLLATTDPHKLPVTVLSRCLQFNLKNLTPDKISEYLNGILEKEMIPFDQPALWLLARAADGSMRDALSLTDQAIAFGGEKVAEQTVREMLGTMDRRLIHPILDAIVAGDVKAMLAAVALLAEQNPDYSGALDELLSLLHRIAIVQAAPDVLDQIPDERERLLQLAGGMTAEDVQLYYQIGLNSQRDLPFAPDMRAGFEMTLLRMLAFKPQGVIEGGEKKKTDVNQQERSSLSSKNASTAVSTASYTSSATIQSKAVAPSTQIDTATNTTVQSSHMAAVARIEDTVPRAAITETAANKLEALTSENWPAFWQRLPLAGVIRNTAAHCCLDKIDGNHYFFTLDKEQTGLFDDSHAARLAETLGVFLGKGDCKTSITPGMPAYPTPNQIQILKKAQLQKEAEESFHSDPLVVALLQQFEGEIVAESITPFQKSIH